MESGDSGAGIFFGAVTESDTTNMLTSGKLHSHLADINEQATEMEECLTAQFAQQEGITEQLKADDMMAWVAAMNSISERVREIIYSELIYN